MRKILPGLLLAPVIISGCATHDPGQVRIEDRSRGTSPSYQAPAPSPDPRVEQQVDQRTDDESAPVARSFPAGQGAIDAAPPPPATSESVTPPPQPAFQPPAASASRTEPSGALLALLEQAETQHQAGNNQRALSSLERAQRIAPREPLVYLQLARLRLDMKDYQRADQLARKGLSLSSGNPQMQEAFRTLLKRIKRIRS